MNIILLAPPAAGKGTQSNLIISKYNLNHISTGDLLRDALKNNDSRSNYIKEEMNAGRLVSDEIILELIKEKILSDTSDNGCILDGFPRNINQAIAYEEMLNSINKKVDYVFYLDIDKEIARKRIVGRLSCNSCGNIYNNLFSNMKPLQSGICDNCGNTLTQRDDDNEITFEKRFDTYQRDTQPLIDFYRNRNLLYDIDSNGEPMDVFKRIEKIINGEL